jgi:non-heme Fe2+,alpha-ketoglutarate-dependent halogenase
MRKEIKVTETVNETATLGLTAEQVESFAENGFIGPFDLYPEDEAPLIWNQALIEMVTSRNKPHNSAIINYDRHLDCNTLSRVVAEPKIVHKLRSLMGDDIICWKTNVFEKNPGATGTGWHQVETHMLYESDTVAYPSIRYTEETRALTQELTVWTAFSNADKEHACLRFIPGSHKKWYYDETRPIAYDIQSKAHSFFGYNFSELQLDQDWNPDESQIVDMEMKAGQFVIFVAKCVHSSYPNTSGEKRIAFANRYVPPSAKIYENRDTITAFGDTIDLDYYGTVLVSGEDRHGYNRLHQQNMNGVPFERVQTNGH